VHTGFFAILRGEESIMWNISLTSSTYSPHDDSLNAVMMIALQNFKVKHIVVTVSVCDTAPTSRSGVRKRRR